MVARLPGSQGADGPETGCGTTSHQDRKAVVALSTPCLFLPAVRYSCGPSAEGLSQTVALFPGDAPGEMCPAPWAHEPVAVQDSVERFLAA